MKLHLVNSINDARHYPVVIVQPTLMQILRAEWEAVVIGACVAIAAGAGALAFVIVFLTWIGGTHG